MNASKLNTLVEYSARAEGGRETEDRVFMSDDGWYWQCRGCADCYGPFETREAAEQDYND